MLKAEWRRGLAWQSTARAPGPAQPLGLGLLEEAWAWPRSWQPRGGQDRVWGGRPLHGLQAACPLCSSPRPSTQPTVPAASRGAGDPARGNNPILVPRGPGPEKPPLPAPSPTDRASTDRQDRSHPGRGARRHQGHQWHRPPPASGSPIPRAPCLPSRLQCLATQWGGVSPSPRWTGSHTKASSGSAHWMVWKTGGKWAGCTLSWQEGEPGSW